MSSSPIEIVDPVEPEEESPEVLAAQMASISETFAREIDFALQVGNSERARQLVTEMREQMNKLMHPNRGLQLVGNSSMNEASVYDQSQCQIDLSLLAYDADRDTYAQLSSDDAIQEVIHQVSQRGSARESRREILRNSLRLNTKMVPRVFDALESCRRALGMERKVNVYAYRNPLPNSYFFLESGEISIALTSPVLESFDDEELRFTIGRKLGHFLFNHHKLPVDSILGTAQNRLYPLQSMRILAWRRAAEISADRMGLLCCRSIEASGRALFKMATGVTGALNSFPIAEWIKELEMPGHDAIGEEADPAELLYTQPFGSIRLKALDIFCRSETYLRLIGETGGEIPTAQMEKEIHQLLESTGAACLKEHHAAGELATRFIFIGGLLTVGSDGEIAPEVLKALSEVLHGSLDEQRIQETALLPREALMEQMKDLCQELKLTTSVTTRYGLIRDLVVIALSDGQLGPAESQSCYELARILDVPEAIVDHVAGTAVAQWN